MKSTSISQEVEFGAIAERLESGGGSMTTMTQLRSVPSNAVIQLQEPADKDSVLYHLVGRMIQITLAVYLLPVLLIALMVGGMGILVLKIGRVLTDLFERSAG